MVDFDIEKILVFYLPQVIDPNLRVSTEMPAHPAGRIPFVMVNALGDQSFAAGYQMRFVVAYQAWGATRGAARALALSVHQAILGMPASGRVFSGSGAVTRVQEIGSPAHIADQNPPDGTFRFGGSIRVTIRP